MTIVHQASWFTCWLILGFRELFKNWGQKLYRVDGHASHLGTGPIGEDERDMIEQGYHPRYVLRSELNNMSELGPIHLVCQYFSKKKGFLLFL